MSEYGYRVYEYIVQATNSELILFFIILAVVAVPLYTVVLNGRKAEKKHQREQQQILVDVVKENTAIMAGLKTTLEASKLDTNSLLAEMNNKLNKVLLIANEKF